MSAPPCVLDTPVYIFAACGKCAHLHGERDADAAPVMLWDAGEGEDCRWRIERAGPRGEGYFHIVSCQSGRAWCNAGGNTSGAGIVTWDRKRADDSIQVYFEPTEKPGYWYISFRDGHMSAHILRESEDNGATVATWSREARPHFWWRFEVYTRICTPAWDLQWRGFGCSLCWFANALDPSTKFARQYADLLFTTEAKHTLNYNGQRERLVGLGLSVVRYNIGGGGEANKWGEAPRFKDVRGFWVKPWSDWDPLADPTAWSWEQDANQRGWLRLAKDRVGPALIVQAFSNSPMYWMTESGCSRGSAATAKENFRADHTGWFANYLARVAEHAKTAWGIEFHSLEPFNEPDEPWWTMANSQQEGCRMSPPLQAAVLRELKTALKRLGLSSTLVACSDENSHRRGTQTWRQLEKAEPRVLDGVDLACVHSYEGLQPARDIGARCELRRTVGDRELWVTEYGDCEGSGMDVVVTIMQDLHFLRCRTWCYWQPIEPYSGWGLLNAEYGAESNGRPLWVYHKYWAFATVSRALRPGMFVLASNASDTVFAYDAKALQLVILVVNTGAAENADFDLTAFGTIGKSYTMVYTAFDGSALLKDTGKHSAQASPRRLSVNLPAECVCALRIGADGLPPCALGVPLLVESAHAPKQVAHLHGEEDGDGARVTLWRREAGGEHLLWRLERSSSGAAGGSSSTFRLVSCRSGRAWCNVGGAADGIGIVAMDSGAFATETELVFRPAEAEGLWYIVFASTGKSAHLLREETRSGAELTTWTPEPRPHHWWRLVPVGGHPAWPLAPPAGDL